MKFFERKNFAEVCSFNCKVTRLFGYFHFHAVRDEKRFETIFCQPLRFLFFIAFGALASIRSASLNIGDSTNSFVIRMGIQILIKATVFMPTVFRIFNFAVRHRHVGIIENVQSIDDELSRLGVAINYTRHFVVAFVVTLLYYAFMMLTFTVDTELTTTYLNIPEADATSALFGAFNVAGYLNYQITHMLIVASIYWRLKSLNCVLEQRILCCQTVNRIGRLQAKLIDTLELVNACFTLNLLNYSFQFIIFTVFFVFGVLDMFVSSHVTAQTFIFNVISSFYFMFFLWFGLWMVTVSSWVSSEGSKTKALIHSKSSTVNAKSLKARNSLCLHLEHSKPFVTCGLFNIDWPYLFTFISAVFSYIIILIQSEGE